MEDKRRFPTSANLSITMSTFSVTSSVRSLSMEGNERPEVLFSPMVDRRWNLMRLSALNNLSHDALETAKAGTSLK